MTTTAHPTTKISVRRLNLFYGPKSALSNISIDIPQKNVTALIGPSGCGKSTFLRSLNRMNDLIENVRIEGTVQIDGVDIYDRQVDVVELRKRVGMIFQKSNPFPKSIFDNVAYGLVILRLNPAPSHARQLDGSSSVGVRKTHSLCSALAAGIVIDIE